VSALFATRPDRTSRRAAARPAVLLTALVCIGAHASSFAHLIAVRHVSCPSHAEEMIHAAGDGAAGAPASGGRSVEAWSSGAAVSAVEDHCLAVGLDRRATAVAPPEALAAPAPNLEPSFAWHRPPAAPAVALFRLAPKTSPPLPGLRRV
jgi:hypothetical protein